MHQQNGIPGAPQQNAPRRSLYSMAGLIVAAVVDIILNLVAAAIQQQAFANQFTPNAIPQLVALALAGLLIGYWLGGLVHLPATVPAQSTQSRSAAVPITRLRALLSYAKLRGQGISLSDILLVGSKLDIDTRTGTDATRHH